MYIQHILFLVLKIQTVLPCVIFVEPLDSSDFNYEPGYECCEEMSWGNQVYSFVGKESTKEYNCNSPCVYTRVDIPHSRYCFKDSGNLHTECQANAVAIGWYNGMAPVRRCVSPGTNITFYGPIDEPNQEDQTCFHVTELSNNVTKETCDKIPYSFIPENSGTFFFAGGPEAKEGKQAAISARDDCLCQSDHEPESLSKLSDNSKKLEEFFHEHIPLTYNETMTQMFKLNMLILSQDQVNVLRNSSACSEVSKECEKCFKDMLESNLYCGRYHNPSNDEDKSFSNSACKNGILAANASCRSCFCEISQVCFPYIKCKRDVYGHTFENNEDSHPCDRKCKGSEPLRCVYNFNLTNLESNGERPVLAYNGTIPGPQIVICEGDELVVNLQNNIIQSKNKGKENTTTLHFHGIREMNRPWADGVPWVSQVPISPGENFTYGFKTAKNHGAGRTAGSYDQAGTYWYHSHVKDQRTNGAYGALIIKPKQTEPDTRFDVDEPKNTIVLQEWYESYTNPNITRLLVNGHGRVDSTSFAKFEVEPNKRYMFRIIGAISEDVPLRLSIDNHTFTAIAADSQDIQPVHNLTSLWVAGGERFHIVVQTMNATEYEQNSPAFKIRVFGVADPNARKKNRPYCTIAWLKYPTQTTTSSNENYESCEGFELSSPHRSLNPVPNSYKWDTRLEDGNIAISDLRATKIKPSLNFFGETLLNTQYIEFIGITFNNLTMVYSDVPILKQKPDTQVNVKRCGTVCNFTVLPTTNVTVLLDNGYINTTCYEDNTDCPSKKNCECQHVIQQPFASFYWTEMVLINNDIYAHAHPIHQHGGWYWVVGMGQYSESINRTFIMHQDRDCINVPYIKAMKNGSKNCLHRNLDHPPAKDTVQVPPGGYVIIRTPLDNKGAWIIHCHINRHVIGGMAMVLNIGGYGYNTSMDQSQCTESLNEKKGPH